VPGSSRTCKYISGFRERILFNIKEFVIKQMEQSPAIPISFHIRMVSLMEILGAVDLILASYAINIAMHNEPNMMIMFAFEVRIFILLY